MFSNACLPLYTTRPSPHCRSANSQGPRVYNLHPIACYLPTAIQLPLQQTRRRADEVDAPLRATADARRRSHTDRTICNAACRDVHRSGTRQVYLCCPWTVAERMRYGDLQRFALGHNGPHLAVPPHGDGNLNWQAIAHDLTAIVRDNAIWIPGKLMIICGVLLRTSFIDIFSFLFYIAIAIVIFAVTLLCIRFRFTHTSHLRSPLPYPHHQHYGLSYEINRTMYSMANHTIKKNKDFILTCATACCISEMSDIAWFC